LIARFGTLSCIEAPFLLSSNNGRTLESHSHACLIPDYRLKQEFINWHRKSRTAWSNA
jgi:hypothetical protein